MKTNHFVQLWLKGRQSSEYGAPMTTKGRTTLYGFVDYAQAREKAIKVGRNILKLNSHYGYQATNESEYGNGGRIEIEFSHRAIENPQKVYTIIYA